VTREQQQRKLGGATLFFAGQVSAKCIVPKRKSLEILGRSLQ
jgi:hypothetical protein